MENNITIKEFQNYKSKLEEQKFNYCLTIEIPVKIKVKQKYELFNDEFGNPYYEIDYDSVNYLEEVKKQNPQLKEMLDFAIRNGWKFDEECIE